MTTHLDQSDNHYEVLSEDQGRELLASRDLGRIAFPLGDETEIFPSTTPLMAASSFSEPTPAPNSHR